MGCLWDGAYFHFGSCQYSLTTHYWPGHTLSPSSVCVSSNELLVTEQPDLDPSTCDNCGPEACILNIVSKIILILQFKDMIKLYSRVGRCLFGSEDPIQSDWKVQTSKEAESSIWQQAWRRKVSPDSWGADIRYQNPLSYQPSLPSGQYIFRSEVANLSAKISTPSSFFLSLYLNWHPKYADGSSSLCIQTEQAICPT